MEQKKTTIIQSKAKCPTCGSDVRVEGTDEGTHYYVPVPAPAPQREDGFLKALDEKIESDKREAKKYNIDTSKGVLFGFNDGLEYARDLYTSTLTKK